MFLAVLAYFLFAAFAIYIEQHPFPGYAGAFFKIGGVTGAYALLALCVYAALYLTRKIHWRHTQIACTPSKRE